MIEEQPVNALTGKYAAILVTDGFEAEEMRLPRLALDKANVVTHLVAPFVGRARCAYKGELAEDYAVDMPLEQARVETYDILLLPGYYAKNDPFQGVPGAYTFLRGFLEQNKLISALGYGPLLLAQAGVAQNQEVTGDAAIQAAMEAAGAHWHNQPIVRGNNLITARSIYDVAALNDEIATLLLNLNARLHAMDIHL